MLQTEKQREQILPFPEETEECIHHRGVDDRIQLAVSLPVCGMSMRPIVELAPRECRFVSPGPVKWGSPILCIFYDTAKRWLQTVYARTHWSSKVKEDWHTGAVLEETLDQPFQDARCAERRANLRYEVACPALALFNDSSTPVAVMIDNYSIEGLRMSTRESLPPMVGSTVHLILPQLGESQHTVMGKIKWQLATEDDGQTLGASLSGQELSWFIALGQVIS